METFKEKAERMASSNCPYPQAGVIYALLEVADAIRANQLNHLPVSQEGFPIIGAIEIEKKPKVD